MKYIEIEMMVRLKRDITMEQTYNVIANNISYALLKSNSDLHIQSGFKGYVFNGFYPIETDKVYKKGNNYILKVRVLENIFQKHFKNLLRKYESNDFQVLLYNETLKGLRKIEKLYTLTPVLIRIDAKHNWIKNNDMLLLQERLNNNLIKKFEYFYGKKIEGDFIQSIKILNKTPFKIPYKNIHYLANKFEIIINQDKISQELAFIAMATGLGEGNSYLGLGFCNAK